MVHREGARKGTAAAGMGATSRGLDIHYILSRCPNGLPGGTPHQFYSREMAKDAIKSAKRIYEAVEGYYSAKGESEILEE